MAANLSGMMSQLNNAIQGSPDFTGLLDIGSQGIGGMLADATGTERMDWMSKGAQGLESQDVASKAITSDNPQSMREAAGKLMQAGRTVEAQRLITMADATQAKQNAILDAGQVTIKEEVERKKAEQAKQGAISLAKRRGELDKAEALESGGLSPAAYYQNMLAMESRKPTTVADGADLVGPDGTVLHSNPKTITRGSGSGDFTAKMQGALLESNKNYMEATGNVATIDAALAKMEDANFKSGWFQDTESFINKAAGMRDSDDYLRTQFINNRNRAMIGDLPPGVASDRDIEIIKKGYPDDNAGKQEIMEYLQAQRNISQGLAEYSEFRSNHISANGDERNLIPAWQANRSAKDYAERKAAIPTKSIARLLANPTDQTTLDNWAIAFPGIDPQDFINEQQSVPTGP